MKGAALASCWDESGDGMCVPLEKHFQSLRVGWLGQAVKGGCLAMPGGKEVGQDRGILPLLGILNLKELSLPTFYGSG